MNGRAPAIAFACLAPVALLAADPGGWYPFGPLKWAAVSTLVPLGAALALSGRGGRARTATAWRDPVRLSTGALLAWLLVATATGRDGLYAWVGTPERHFGWLTWALCALALATGRSLAAVGPTPTTSTGPTGGNDPPGPSDEGADARVVRSGDTRAEVRLLLGGIVVAAAGLGALATAEAAGWEPRIFALGTRLSGPLGSPAYLGAASAVLVPISTGVALDARWSRATRIVAAAGSAGCLVALVGSGARAAWVGAVAAAVTVAWSRRAGLAAHRRATAVAVLAVAATVGLLALVGPIGARVGAAFDADAPGGRGRLDEWRIAARAVAARPLLGAGPEGYRLVFPEVVDERYQVAHGRDPLPDRAHSAPLDVAVAGGIPALVAWAALVGVVGRHVRRALHDPRPWLVGVAAGLVAHGAGSLFLFPVFELEPLAWLLAGVVVATTATAPGRALPRGRRPAGAALAALALLAATAGALDVAADRAARRADVALARGDGRAAARAARQAAGRRPDVLRLHLLVARAAVAADEGTLAGLAALDDALALSPDDPVARRERARLLVVRADATRTPAHLATARDAVATELDRDPLDPQLWALRAVVAELDGDEPGARAAVDRARALTPERDRPPPTPE
ncbi:MAG: O-antigen ligase family protein [Acidimicrobiia bacterium]